MANPNELKEKTMNATNEKWIGESLGWAKPIDWDNPEDVERVRLSTEHEAMNEEYLYGEMVACIGQDAAYRRRNEFAELMAPDYTDYSREHRSPGDI